MALVKYAALFFEIYRGKVFFRLQRDTLRPKAAYPDDAVNPACPA
jgi:hypothetical protein